MIQTINKSNIFLRGMAWSSARGDKTFGTLSKCLLVQSDLTSLTCVDRQKLRTVHANKKQNRAPRLKSSKRGRRAAESSSKNPTLRPTLEEEAELVQKQKHMERCARDHSQLTCLQMTRVFVE